MRRLSRLGAFFAGFCLLAGAPASFAQDGAGVDDGALAFDLPALTGLKIAKSSQTAVPDVITVETAEIPKELPRILSERDAERLMRNEGTSLQWISWEERGPVWVAVSESGHWLLLGGQNGGKDGFMDLEGFITEIGEDYFVYEGTIRILGAPDKERACEATKTWRFEVTQNRSYYRLREFEWCDYLTDYIDIYFPASLK